MNVLPSVDSLFDHAACGLLVTTPDGYIRKVNQTFCNWVGHDKAALIDQRRIQDLLTMGGRVFHQTHWAPLMQMQGSTSEVQFDMRHSNGQTFPVIVNAIRRQHGDAIFHELSVFVALDRKQYEKELLLARRAAEEALIEKETVQRELHQLNQELSMADRQKDIFIATLAHEMRNPLMPIAMAASMIKRKGQDSGLDRYSATIERQVRQLSLLLDDLIDVSRISNGSIALRMQDASLKEVLQVAVDLALPLFEERQQDFTIVCDDTDVMLYCDPVRVSQVIGNLLVNASKYTNDHGRIELAATVHGNELVVTVQDNGIGIAAEKIDAIFDMYSQVDGAAKRARNGIGVGLALVRKLCELHGGHAAVHSDGEGHGSTFHVFLPILKDGVESTASST